MKTYLGLFFSLIVVAGCTPALQLQQTRWSGVGERPQVSTEGQVHSKFTSQSESIEMTNQTLAGFKVEGSFVKSIYNQQGQLTFQSSALLSQNKNRQLRLAEKINSKKEEISKLFFAKNPRFNTWQILRPAEVVFYKDALAHYKPTLKLILSDRLTQVIEIYVAKDGVIEKQKPAGSQFDDHVPAQALIFPKGPQKSKLSSTSIMRRDRVENLSNSILEIVSQSTLSLGSQHNLEFQPPDERFDQVQVFYFANQYLTWLLEKVKFVGPMKVQILTHVGYPQNTNTAFYFQNQIRLGTGDGQIYSRIMWDPSIVMHELSHAMIDAMAQLPFEGEGGSINEGFSDYLACSFLQSPLLAEQSYAKAEYKRSIDKPLKMSELNGGLYHDSALVSSFFWQLQKQIGNDKVLPFALKVLQRLGPHSNFDEFKQTIHEQAPITFNGNDLQKINQLIKEREI
jgi:hypothetical protein